MGNGNSADWMRAAKKANLNMDVLRQSKTRMFEMLDELGLPRPRAYYISGEEIDSPRIEGLFTRHGPFFCRLVGNPDKRPYKELLESAEQFRKFCLRYNMNQYTAMLVEKSLTHTGSIIATEHQNTPVSCVIELVEGDGPDLFHGKMTPVHAEFEWTRALHYSPQVPPTDYERSIVLAALEMIGGPEHPFPGYYEFEVHPKRGIVFRNYQGPGTIYATTPLSLSLKESPVTDFRE